MGGRAGRFIGLTCCGTWGRANCGCFLEGRWDCPQGGEVLPGPSGQGAVEALGPPSFLGPPSPCHPPFWGWGWGRWRQGGSCRSLYPPCARHLTTLSVSTGRRAPASLGRRAGAGRAAPGVSQCPTCPLSPRLFRPLPPLPLFSLPLDLPLALRAGRKPGRTSSFLSFAVRGGCHDLPVHPPKPQLLPRVLTPECVGRSRVRKSALGSPG